MKHLNTKIFKIVFLAFSLYAGTALAQTVDEENSNLIWQLGGREPRISVSLRSKGINIGDYEDVAAIIKNNFANELQVEIVYTITDYCSASETYRVSHLLKAYEQYAPSPFFEGTGFNSTCATIKTYGSKKKLGSRIWQISYELVRIEDMTAKREKEALAADQVKQGNQMLEEGKLDLAESFFNKALENQPENYAAKSGLQTVKARRDKLAADKTKVADLIKEGNDLLAKKDLDAAESKFKSALAIDKENADANAGLTKVADLKKTAADNKTKVSTSIKDGNDLLAKKDLDGAEKKYNEVLKLDPENAEAKNGLQKVKDARATASDPNKKKEESDSTKNLKDAADNSSSTSGSSADSDNSGSTSTSENSEPVETAEERDARLEQERIDRQNEYYATKQSQNEELRENANASDAAQMEGMLALALIIYQNMGNDKPENIFKGNAPHFNMQLGFNTLSAPIINNSSLEDYDGNNYSYTNQAKNGNVFTLGLEGNVELWPLYGKNFGFGITAGGSGGYNGGSTSLIYQTGIKWFLGHHNVQLAGEYTIGRKNLSFVDILNSQEIGSGGTSKYGFRRFGLGPSFVIKGVDFIGETTMRLDIMPIFELASSTPVLLSNTPMVMRWDNGIRVNAWFHNRMHIYAELFPQYARTGEVEYAISPELTRKGTYFSLGVIRHWDFFGDDAYASTSSFQDVENFFNKRHTFSLYIANPSIGWFGITDKEKETFFNSNLSPGLVPIGLDYDLNLHKNISAYIGGNVNLNSGGTFRTKSDNKTPVQAFGTILANSTDLRYRMVTAEIPVGIRLLSNMVKTDRYWLKAGIASNIALEKNVAVNTNIKEPAFTDMEYAGSEVKTFYTSYQLGVGTDFMAMYSGFRVGLTYSRTTAPFAESINAPLKSLTLNAALLF